MPLDADRFHPGNSNTADAGAEHGAELGHHQPAVRADLHRVAAATEPPFLDRLPGERIPHLDARVAGKVGWRSRRAMPFQIGWGSDRYRPGFDEFPRDQRGFGGHAKADGNVEPLADKVTELVPCDQIERQVGIERQKFVQMRCQQEPRKKGVDIDAEPAAYCHRRSRGQGDRVLDARQQRAYLCIKASALVGQRHGTRRAIEKPYPHSRLEPRHCPANA